MAELHDFAVYVVVLINIKEITMGWKISLHDERNECITGQATASFSRNTMLHGLKRVSQLDGQLVYQSTCPSIPQSVT
jgi:hypothetical protein